MGIVDPNVLAVLCRSVLRLRSYLRLLSSPGTTKSECNENATPDVVAVKF